jgi:hypothetical protein
MTVPHCSKGHCKQMSQTRHYFGMLSASLSEAKNPFEGRHLLRSIQE